MPVTEDSTGGMSPRDLHYQPAASTTGRKPALPAASPFTSDSRANARASSAICTTNAPRIALFSIHVRHH